MLGSLLSYYELNNGGRGRGSKSNRVFNQLFPKLGITLIIFAIFFFTDKDLLPSFYSLIPLTGVCLIIWFSNKDEIVTKILSNKILVFFGLISYSLYLFHYPIFAFGRVFEIFNDYYKFIFVFLTIIVSIFSYYFIERLFRDRKIISFKKLVIILSSTIVFIVSFNFYVIKEDGIRTRVPKILQQKLSKESNIKFHQKKFLQKVILIGDSHAGTLEYHLNEELKKNNFSLFRFETKMYLKNFNYINRKTKQIDKEFIESNNKIDKFLIENPKLIVIFNQRWSYRILETGFDNEEGYKEYKKEEDKYYDYLEPINIKTSSQQQREKYIKEGLISQINNIVNQGHKLILVYPVPELAFEPLKLLHNKYIKTSFLNKKQYLPLILTTSYEVYKKRNKLIFEILESVKNENIYRVYPHSHFCNKQIENRCISNDKENIFYYDDDHLSLSGSKFVVDDILKIIKNIQ